MLGKKVSRLLVRLVAPLQQGKKPCRLRRGGGDFCHACYCRLAGKRTVMQLETLPRATMGNYHTALR